MIKIFYLFDYSGWENGPYYMIIYLLTSENFNKILYEMEASQYLSKIDKYISKIFESYGAILGHDRNGYYFDNKENAKKCCKYLNDTYLIMIKLMGN